MESKYVWHRHIKPWHPLLFWYIFPFFSLKVSNYQARYFSSDILNQITGKEQREYARCLRMCIFHVPKTQVEIFILSSQIFSYVFMSCFLCFMRNQIWTDMWDMRSFCHYVEISMIRNSKLMLCLTDLTISYKHEYAHSRMTPMFWWFKTNLDDKK